MKTIYNNKESYKKALEVPLSKKNNSENKINKEINNVLNKIQFSKNGATEVESEILKDYYTSNKELKLKNSNFFKRIFLKYLKMI